VKHAGVYRQAMRTNPRWSSLTARILRFYRLAKCTEATVEGAAEMSAAQSGFAGAGPAVTKS